LCFINFSYKIMFFLIGRVVSFFKHPKFDDGRIDRQILSVF
jgi:hypothetical protein